MRLVSVFTTFHLPRVTVRASGVMEPLEPLPWPWRVEGQFSPEEGRASVLVAGSLSRRDPSDGESGS